MKTKTVVIYRQGGTHRFRYIKINGNEQTINELLTAGYPAWEGTEKEAHLIGAGDIVCAFTNIHPDA